MLVSGFAVTSFAQSTPEECQAIYDKFLANRKGPELEKYKTALASGKDYLAKCTDQPEVKDYVSKQVPKIEITVRDMELYARFNDAVPNKKWDDAFDSGRQLIGFYPDNSLDIMLILASIGFDNANANPAVDKYNGDAINYAKMALQKMEAGKPSETYGAFAYTYKTKDCPDGKLNATGWMNWTIGNIMYYRQKQTKDALPYIYKASQVGCETVKNSEVYRTIGAWYIDEFKKLEDQKNAKYEEMQKAFQVAADAQKPNSPDASKVEELKKAASDLEKQYNDIAALQKGYMERVMDAYARAYKVVNVKADQKYKDSLLNNAKRFYGFRYNDANYDAWYSKAMATPFVDPSTPVVPVVEATPTTTTGTPSAMNVSSDSSTNTTSNDTRPRTAPTTTGTPGATTKPAATTTTASSTTTTKPAPAKKPAPKKKGTR